jgi:glycosyltransferase involved in cell wall biosynthesis
MEKPFRRTATEGMKYDVTIGIPVYKSEAYIRQALESALAQTYPSIEFLIVDDGGGDTSGLILQDIKKDHCRGADIHIMMHSHNMGVSASRNQIIEEAQGVFLYFMDSDDVIAENTIDLLMQKIREFDAEIAFGSYEKIELDGSRIVCEYQAQIFLGEDFFASYAYRKFAGIQASACNFLVKTSLLRENHHRFVNSSYWEDLVFTFDLVTYISRAVLLPDITYSYICREGSLSHYQKRKIISKNEILQNIQTVNYLKNTSLSLCHKVYYPNRCRNIVMTNFYIACNILKRRKDIVPSFSDEEIKGLMFHPATFRQICLFRQSFLINMLLYIIGKLPSKMCVLTIWCLGKVKKLV